MAIDVSKLSEKQLLKLQVEVADALKNFEKTKRDAARKAAEAAAKKHGFSLNDLVGAAKAKASKPKAPAKYRNPADPSQTWSGRGRQPGWIKDAIKTGKDLKKFEI